MAYRLRFGSFDFARTLRPADESSSQDTAAQSRPRASGSLTQIGRREPTILPIRGDLTAATPDALETLHEALKAAVYAGKADLWFGRDDLYYKSAQLKSFGTNYRDGLLHGLLASYSLVFEAADYPEPFAVNAITTASLLNVAAYVVMGDAPAAPTWTITVGAEGTGPITLTNAATGESCRLTKSTNFAAGAVIVLTRDGYTVTENGVATFGLLQGRIPSLIAGNNTITWTAGGTATIASVGVSYIPRYR